MPKTILGKKLGMTQVFSEEGELVPVTVIAAGPCKVVQVKNKEQDGYEAVQISYQEMKESRANKPHRGHFEKAGIPVMKYLREISVDNIEDFEVGQEIKADIFEIGEKVDVTGTSKGKGFAGNIKRWGEKKGLMSHGSRNHRRPGSSGPKGPAKVIKGFRSPGRLGSDRVTVKNLEIVKTDINENYILVKGAIPGPKKSFVIIRSNGDAN